MEEAKSRWLRPNEIHAILCNHKYFTIYVKPINLPPGGMMVLFDRKMLRNFRKDGHNWKKKKDGKTVKEAHEHLKVGNEEKIHVYYAHGEDNPTFVRRCYWLLDKKLENIVLVHYRDTQESQGSPSTPVNSNSCSILSEPSVSQLLSEESDSVVDQVYYTSEKAYLDPNESIQDHEYRIHEINTLEWDELVVPEDPNKSITTEAGIMSGFEQQNQYESSCYTTSHPIEISDTSDVPQHSQSGSSEHLSDSAQSRSRDRTPIPAPAPTPAPETSSQPRWPRRSVSAIRDFPPGCGPSNSAPRAHPTTSARRAHPTASAPPTSPLPETPAPVPYHVYRAMVLDRDYLYARNLDLARMLDQSVASSSLGYISPSDDVRSRVRALYDVALQQATNLDAYSAEEARDHLATLVNWLIPQLQFLGGTP
ncbi:hypothetical protein DCAR_0726774 [Daucus carota subsp. sativus]|uniref:Uncharacterized protein n=1 Tax=Daucus carota subsp. sativus TaxID=79200 RepID=A0A161X1N8_DAUCS|nr:hypothetical protein DCAR_0726774 [Daucus carota subsp. sativus]